MVRKSDSQVKEEVLDELRWDSRIEETDVGVEVDNGIVTLTGTVDSYAKRLAAEEAAHSVTGVLDVANDIKVKFAGDPARTDTEIAQAVRNALRWQVYVPDEQIKATVSDHRVTLEGTVNLLRQSWDAERAVQGLTGVRGVTNKLKVRETQTSPEEIRKRIQQALERRAETEARGINVSLKDGEAIITGKVRSWAERNTVVNAVRHAPGIQKVRDVLKVDPYLPIDY
jgi:osmotically-inducible protein OsmY